MVMDIVKLSESSDILGSHFGESQSLIQLVNDQQKWQTRKVIVKMKTEKNGVKLNLNYETYLINQELAALPLRIFFLLPAL
jgi:hypothetical protein